METEGTISHNCVQAWVVSNEERARMDTLKKMFYLQLNGSESLLLYDHLEMKPLGFNQLQNEPADVQQLFAIKEEVPWSSSLTDQDPGPLRIKEEKEELWTSQEGEQFYAPEETDINTVSVSVKNEEDEERPQFSQLHLMKTEDNRETEPPTCCLATEIKTEHNEEDNKGPEPGWNPSPDRNSQPHLDKNTSETSGDIESGDRGDWKLKPVGETPKSSFRCSVCGKQFLYKQSFQKHMMCHLENDSSTSLVNEPISNKQNGNLQKKGHTADKLFPCRDCGKKFGHRSNLNYHMMIHTGKKPFICSDCSKTFRSKTELQYHMMIHTGERPFMCSDCTKTFRAKGELKIHMRIHTGERPFICSDCNQTFRTKDVLQYHMMIHTGERPFTCSNCNQTFRGKGELKIHMMIHTGEKPFICSECNKTFRTKGGLRYHMTIHTGEKPFGCSECNKTFRAKGEIKNHMMIHTGVKPFICSDCSKTFKSNGELKKHMKIHTREKPFISGDCGKMFRSKGELQYHMMVHTRAEQLKEKI